MDGGGGGGGVLAQGPSLPALSLAARDEPEEGTGRGVAACRDPLRSVPHGGSPSSREEAHEPGRVSEGPWETRTRGGIPSLVTHHLPGSHLSKRSR